MTKGTIVKIDINGFTKLIKGKTLNETAEFMVSFYRYVAKHIHSDWNFVKTIGDCVLISIPKEVADESIEQFHSTIKDKYDVSTQYRKCRFVIETVQIGSYKCTDIFGYDINRLFMSDAETKRIG